MNETFKGDEFDSMVELITTILFMAFGIFATALSVRYITAKTELVEHEDKIEITAETHEAEDPFYYTGYQAYMFAWHMDELSYVSLSWLDGHASSIASGAKSSAHVDTDTDDHVTIGTLDENGAYRASFIAWRNRTIVGTGYATARNVKKSIATLAQGVGTYKLYRGVASGGKRYLYHLELTGDYTQNNNLGSDPNTGGKTYSWVLAPYYH